MGSCKCGHDRAEHTRTGLGGYPCNHFISAHSTCPCQKFTPMAVLNKEDVLAQARLVAPRGVIVSSCRHCGQGILSTAKVCPFCGKEVKP